MEPIIANVEIKNGKVRVYEDHDPIEYRDKLLKRKEELETEMAIFVEQHNKLMARDQEEINQIDANLAALE